MIRWCLLILMAAAWAADPAPQPPPKITQEQADAEWRKAMEESERVRRASAAQPPVESPASRPPTYDEDRAAREREAARLRAEQEEWKRQQEAREAAERERQARIEEEARQRQEERHRRDREEADRRRARQAEQEALQAAQEEEDRRVRERRARESMTQAIVVGVFLLFLIALLAYIPAIVGRVVQSPQRRVVRALAIPLFLLGVLLGSALLATVGGNAAGPILLGPAIVAYAMVWCAALAIAAWRYDRAS